MTRAERDRAVLAHQPLVRSLAKSHVRRVSFLHYDWRDVAGEINVALLRSFGTVEVTSDVTAYVRRVAKTESARLWYEDRLVRVPPASGRHAIGRTRELLRRLPRRIVPGWFDVAPGDVMADEVVDDTPDPERIGPGPPPDPAQLATLRAVYPRLSPSHRLIIDLRADVAGTGCCNDTEIGRVLNRPRATVRRMRRDAEKRFRLRLARILPAV